VPDPRPQLILRLGTHAEKEYVERVAQFLDGVMVGSNLVESTPGATASLIVALCGAKHKVQYYVDPMTYAFGTYVDRYGRLRSDLDWIKSDQKVKGGKKGQTSREFKRSYRKLSSEFGAMFATAVNDSKALTPAQFAAGVDVAPIVTSVLDYQLKRIRREFENDPEFRQYADQVPVPAALMAPYFYCEPSAANDWLSINLRLAATAAAYASSVPKHAIVCADIAQLHDPAFITRLKSELPHTRVNGVWLWFSQFAEDEADLSELQVFRSLVADLSRAGLKVYNLHGGYFSLALSKFGLTGISHGVGYGEQKDVVPVIGQAIPTVRYYLPALHKKLGVPQIERAFPQMGVVTAADFHAKVCDCAVCKGIVVNSAADFRLFGETQLSASAASEIQTPQAAKRCRFHFLVNRIRERDSIQPLSVASIQAQFDAASRGWGAQPTLKDGAKHLMKWRAALG
jgi:hypothetical protein